MDIHLESYSQAVDYSRQTGFYVNSLALKHRYNRPWWNGFFLLVILAGCLCLQPSLQAQPAAPGAAVSDTNSAATGTPGEQIANLQTEITNTCQQVRKIVNQPVRAYARTQGLHVSFYPEGWFHPGATRPDFNDVDVRQSQQLIYANEPYVTSSSNPGVVFMGRDLEFNGSLKYFYTDRSLPKHKLTEAQMIEINRLYRIIGHDETEIRRLQTQIDEAAGKLNNTDNTETETQTVVLPGQPLAEIRSIPRQTRLLYGGIAIGALVVLVVVLRLFRKKSE